MVTKQKTATQRAAVYVRVSSEEQVEGYSLDAQVRAANLYCEAHGWELMQEYRDEGKSARTDDLAKRPAFARLLADAEAGLIDVIVVHKLDRFARNLRVTLETLERLQRAGVGFVSISEQMDFTTPIGRVILATLAAFAQYYSDNLATEVKKGKAERKAQGFANGLLPFGVKKGGVGNGTTPNGSEVPVPNPETYPGLLLAFRLAAEGKSDRDVAEALNAEGYRTTGNRGSNPFTKDTVCRLLQNRFYLGELPDGRGGWTRAVHQAVLDPDLFAEAQRTRAANQTNPAKVNHRHRRYSLSGLAVCGHCGGPLHFHTSRGGRARVYCYQARQASSCGQRSVFLDGIEEQVAAYLATFALPEGMVGRIVALHERARDDQDDAERRRRDIDGRLERLKRMFEWGDLTETAYLADRERLRTEQATLTTSTDWAGVLGNAAAFLGNLPAAWEAANPAQRNALARTVFRSVEIADGRVVAVVPQPDFAPFFNLTEVEAQSPERDEGQPVAAAPERQASTLAGGSDGLRSRARTLKPGFVVVGSPPARRSVGTSGRAPYSRQRRSRLSDDERAVIRSLALTKSLRSLATDFGVSHETVRSAMRAEVKAQQL